MSILRHAIAAPSRIAASTGIAQDNIIFALVLFAFVVWITTKGELGKYLSFFTPVAGKQGPVSPDVTASSTTGTTPAVAAANATFGNPNVPNPGLLGGANPVGALTANPSTLFGALPTLQAIPGAIQNNLVAPVQKFLGF